MGLVASGFLSSFYVPTWVINLSTSAIALGAALLGGPVSITQVVSASIMGAGAADRLNKIRIS